MKFKKYISFILIIILSSIIESCGGGGSDSGDENLIAPPPIVVDPPSAATLLFPEKDQICESGTSVSTSQSKINFQWSAGSNADTYDLKITNLESNQLSNFNGVSGTNKEVTLDKGTPYSWEVVSNRNGTLVTATSSSWKFYLSGEGLTNYPPYPAELLSPKSGKLFLSSTQSVDLSWDSSDPDGEVLSYTLYFDTVDGLQEPLAGNKNLTAKSKTVDVGPATTYYWRIKTSDTNQNSSYSQVYTFRID